MSIKFPHFRPPSGQLAANVRSFTHFANLLILRLHREGAWPLVDEGTGAL